MKKCGIIIYKVNLDYKEKNMKMKSVSVLGIVAVLGGLIVLGTVLSKKHGAKTEKAPSFTVEQTRKKDYGFKLKIDDCVSESQKDLIVVDVDNSNTYVLADAKQYFQGPHPITEDQLVKISAAELDQKQDVVKVSCADLEQKYLVSELPKAEDAPTAKVAQPTQEKKKKK